MVYAGDIKLNKRIIRKVNKRVDYRKRTDLLAAAMTCFAVAGIVVSYWIWG